MLYEYKYKFNILRYYMTSAYPIIAHLWRTMPIKSLNYPLKSTIAPESIEYREVKQIHISM